jgi:hypothetical protein
VILLESHSCAGKPCIVNLQDVLYIPSFETNFYSIPTVTVKRNTFCGNGNTMIINDPTGTLIVQEQKIGKLYIVFSAKQTNTTIKEISSIFA